MQSLTHHLGRSAYLLGGANGARAHAHTESIGTSVYEALRLRTSDNIARNNLQVRMLILQVLQHLYLVD